MSIKAIKGTPWWVSGDINGFFGLFSNSLTNFLTAVGLLAFAIKMPTDIVFGSIVPAVAISIGIGNLLLAWMAKRMSVRENRDNVTAMPYGLSVPHYFAVTFAVILPVYLATNDWTAAWATGIAWNVVQGVVMLAGSVVGPTIQKYVPRTAMLGALAGLAITLIATNPIGEVYSKPFIGLTSFAILIVGWLAHKKLPGNIPAGALAIMVGTAIAWFTGYMHPADVSDAIKGFNIPLPLFKVGLFATGFSYIAPFLPAAIPLAIYDFLESLDNLESAHAAGEHYPVAQAMAIPAVLTLIAASLGSCFPTIIYMGHPGWKATGARIGYSVATGVAILVLAFTGLLRLVSAVIPLVALLPILMFIAMVIGTQAFSTAKQRHMPAVILAFLPFIGSIISLKINSVIGAVNAALASGKANVTVQIAEQGKEGVIALTNAMLSNAGVPLLGWARLSQGDILIAMLLASIAIFTIDRKYKIAAIYSSIAAVLSFFGIIHASKFGINAAPEVALGYLGMGAVLLFMNFYRPQDNQLDPEVLAEDAAHN